MREKGRMQAPGGVHPSIRSVKRQTFLRRLVLVTAAVLVASTLASAGFSLGPVQNGDDTGTNWLQMLGDVIKGLKQPTSQSNATQLASPSVPANPLPRDIAVEGPTALEALVREYEGQGNGTRENPWVLDAGKISEEVFTLRIEGTRDHLVIRGLDLQGDGTQVALTLRDVGNVTIENASIMGFHTGIHLSGTIDMRVVDSVFSRNQMGLKVEGVDSLHVHRSHFLDNTHAVRVMGSDGTQQIRGITVSDSVIASGNSPNPGEDVIPGESGILLEGMGHRIEGNTFVGHHSIGLRDRAMGTIIAQNEFKGHGKHGVLLVENKDTILTQNRFSDHQEGYALMAHKTSGTLIENNTFDAAKVGGIGGVQSVDLRIIANTLEDSDRGVILWAPQVAMVESNTITGGNFSVRVIEGKEVTLRENQLDRPHRAAITLTGVSEVLVEGNRLQGPMQQGLYAGQTDSLHAKGNHIVDARTGVLITDGAHQTNLQANRLHGDGVAGIHIGKAQDVSLEENSIVYYAQGLRVDAGADAVEVQGGSYRMNDWGIVLTTDHPVKVAGTEFFGNRGGILVQKSGGHELIGLTVVQNGYGVAFLHSEDTTFAHNVLTGNQLGLFMDNATGNLFYDNKFDNGHFESDINIRMENSYGNKWYIDPEEGPNIIGGYWIAGNYWHDYEGMDITGNGLGDIPHEPLPHHPDLEALFSSFGFTTGPFDLHPLVPR